MKKFIKYFALTIAIISVSVLVSGCSSRTKNVEELSQVFTIWAFDDEDVWKPIIRDLEKELKGYEIKYVKKEFNSSYENDSLNSILSGEGPDVWAIPNDWVYRHKDKLVPMPESALEEINLDEKFVPVVKQSVYFDQKTYGLAPAIDTLMVYYNNTLFDDALDEFNTSHKGSDYAEARKTASQLLREVPVTWKEFSETVKLINTRNGDGFSRSGVALGTYNNTSQAVDVLYDLMLQNETSFTSEDLQTAIFNLPQTTNAGTKDTPAKRALDFYLSFSNPNSNNYSWNEAQGSDVEAFVNNKVAMIFGYESTKWL